MTLDMQKLEAIDELLDSFKVEPPRGWAPAYADRRMHTNDRSVIVDLIQEADHYDALVVVSSVLDGGEEPVELIEAMMDLLDREKTLGKKGYDCEYGSPREEDHACWLPPNPYKLPTIEFVARVDTPEDYLRLINDFSF